MKPEDKEWAESMSEIASLHNKNCCIFFDDIRACDAFTTAVNCCENIRTLYIFISSLVNKSCLEAFDKGYEAAKQGKILINKEHPLYDQETTHM